MFPPLVGIQARSLRRASRRSAQERKAQPRRPGPTVQPRPRVVTDGAVPSGQRGLFASSVARPEPRPDVTVEVKLVCWRLHYCNPNYSLSSHGNLRAPPRPLHTHGSCTLRIGTRWGLQGMRSGPSPYRGHGGPGGTGGAHCRVEPEPEARSPAPAPVLL